MEDCEVARLFVKNPYFLPETKKRRKPRYGQLKDSRVLVNATL